MTTEIQLCARSCCSNPVTPSTRPMNRAPKIYCSERCRRRAERQREQQRRSENKQLSRSAHRAICRRPGCGKPTQLAAKRGPIASYCSSTCRDANAKRARRIEQQRPKLLTCVFCEKEFEVSGRGQRKFCSKEHAIAQLRRDRGTRTWDQWLADLAARPPAVPPTWICELPSCGAEFQILTPGADGYRRRSYCSAEHYAEHRRQDGVMWTPPSPIEDRDSRSGGRRVKAAGFGAAVEVFTNLEILERDGWRCQLCGCKTPQHLRGSKAQNAPEVDHKIPVTRGGAHTRENCWCLCHRCNHHKGDKLLEELQPIAQQPGLLDSIDGDG